MGKPYQGKDGAWYYYYTNHRQQRKKFYIGARYDERGAIEVASLIDNLVSARIQCREPSTIDAEKIKRVLPLIRKSLINHDLIDATPDDTIPTLKQLCDEFLDARRGMRPNSFKNDQQAVNKLLRFFVGKRRIDTIMVAECKDFRVWLETECNNGDATINRAIKRCRTIFKRGVEMKYISDNPFSKVKAGKSINKSRRNPAKNATMKNVLQVLQFSPCQEFTMAILLARFEGLRTPSEIKNLKFSNFEGAYFRILDETKTGTREVPIAGIVRKQLEILKKNAKPGQELIFTKKLGSENTIASRLRKLMKKAGIDWGRPLQNLRVAFLHDLSCNGVSTQGIDNWGGNSGPVRVDHYDLPNDGPDLAKFCDIFGDSGGESEPFSKTFSKQMDEIAHQANEVQYEMDQELKKFGRVSKKAMCCFKDGMANVTSYLEMFSALTPKSFTTSEARETWLQTTTERARAMFRTLARIDKLSAEIPPRGIIGRDCNVMGCVRCR